jgi:hypothetical protein
LSNGFLKTGQERLHPLLKPIPKAVRQRISCQYIKSGVDVAATEGGHVHLWTHLFNISNDEQVPPIEHGLEYIAEKRDAGEVEIKLMCELPDVIDDG